MNGLVSGLNWYDLYRKNTPLGLKADDPERYGETEIGGVKHTYKRGKTMQEYTPWVRHAKGDQVFGAPLTDYINLPETRKAMNIPESVGKFELCRSPKELKYNI